MRFLVAAILFVHGAIHVLGFLKPWGLAEVPQLSGRTLLPITPAAARAVGLIWLLTAAALVAAGALRIAGREAWWMVAAPAVLVSQALVIFQWGDAWAGTLANIVLALAVAAGAGTWQFREANREAARRLLEASAVPDTAAPDVLGAEELATLPAPVRRWIEASGAVGRPRARTVRLRQRGGMRTAPGQDYMPAVADQYFRVDRPGFVWTVDVMMMRVVPVVGRDTFADGRGRMLIKAAGLVTVADGTGPTFDQGTALRFLGEIIWFPSAALAPYIRWDGLDDRRARATISTGDVTASAEFEFDDRGRFVGLTAQRYYGGQSLETWVIPATEWKTIRGIEMPVRGGAVWRLASGDFDYYQWEILDVETNPTSLF